MKKTENVIKELGCAVNGTFIPCKWNSYFGKHFGILKS
jgi:hypothetical protein